MSVFKTFNRNYSEHSPNRAIILRELTNFLKYTPDQFVIENTVDNLSLVEFFRKLNNILLTDDLNYDYHWIVFQVIEIAVKNADTLQYLVDTVRIVMGLSNFAVKASSSLTEAKQIQLWTLIDQITIGMKIVAEEPHFASLIEHLVESIKKPNIPNDIKLLQVSILTNLCFNNDIAVACLLRYTKAKELLNAVKEERVFWCKLAMAMTHLECSMYEFELVSYLKSVFQTEYFTGLIRGNDRRLLRNILEMLVVGCERDEHSRQIMQQFDFNECIGSVLEFVVKSEIPLQNSTTMNSFFGIVNSILSVSNTSIESNKQRLFKLIIDSSDATNISPQAIKSIRLLASSIDVSTDSTDLVKLLTQLIEKVDGSQDNLLATTEVYQLLLELYAKYPAIINQLPKETIDKSIDTNTLLFTLTDSNLLTQISRLQWIFVITKDLSDGKLIDVMKMKEVHHIVARGLKCCNEEILAPAMELLRSNHFPVQAVSKILSTGTSNPRVQSVTQSSNCDCECKSTVEVVRPYFSAALETRLNNEINRVSAKLENSNVGLSDYINLLQCQNSLASDKEKIMQRQIKSLSDQKTIQSNEIGALKLAVRNGLSKINELESSIEILKSHGDMMTTAYETMKIKYANVTTNHSDIRRKYAKEREDNSKIIALKDAQILDLKVQHQNDIDLHVANHAQLKNEHDREKLELKAQHESELECVKTELIEQYQRKAKKLKAVHDQDLETYSTKSTEMKHNFERELADLRNRQSKESEATLVKIEQLEKQLTEKVVQLAKFAKTIEERNQTLAEKEKALVQTTEELAKSKEKFENLRRVLTE